MKTPTISFLFFIIILFSSCFPSDVRFIDAQPEHLEELSFIPNQFQGVFVINKDTVVVTDCTINGDSINSDSLVVKSWGNYLFVNFLENGIYKLGCAKVVNAWNNQNISLEYFRFFDELPINESASLDEAEKLQLQEMIADKHNPLVDIDSTDDLHFILDNISINHFQSLLNNAKSEEVIRIE
tara:strand:+ start:73 stop:621 length:549 start_codon:yes stop_codon:yes gene_type:complete